MYIYKPYALNICCLVYRGCEYAMGSTLGFCSSILGISIGSAGFLSSIGSSTTFFLLLRLLLITISWSLSLLSSSITILGFRFCFFLTTLIGSSISSS